MKLTDEQREEIRSKLRNGNLVGEVDVEALLSSEQAWKEEAERLRQLCEMFFSVNFTQQEQLNQAKESLQRLLDNNELRTGEDAREARIDIEAILSSLREKE